MKRVMVASVVVAALALSACGSSTQAARKAALKTYVASLGAQQNLQVTLTAKVSGPSAAKASTLNTLSFGLNLTNPSGAALSQANGTANTELTLTSKGTTFLWVRSVSNTIYLKVDLTGLSWFGNTKIPAAELSAAQVLLGGRWFELPPDLLKSIVPKSGSKAADTSKDQAIATQVIGAITKLIDSAKYSQHNGTYTESLTVLAIGKALDPVILRFTHVVAPTAKTAPGTVKLSVSTSGTTATGAAITVTEPGTHGTTTATVNATFAHANSPVTAPSGSTLLTKQFLQSLGLGG